MKKIITLFAICIFALTTFKSSAQEKLSSYDNTYSKKTYEVLISSKEKEKFTLYVDAMSLDKLHEEGGFMIDQKQHSDFLSAIEQAKIKYEEWVKTAKENNVTDLEKTMSIKSKCASYFKYGSKWNFQFLVSLSFDFRVLESGGETKHLLIVRTGELKSSSNEFMKVDGFVLVFSSIDEINGFTAAISLDKISEFVNKPKSEELFKD
jgi:hypothetical protein